MTYRDQCGASVRRSGVCWWYLDGLWIDRKEERDVWAELGIVYASTGVVISPML